MWDFLIISIIYLIAAVTSGGCFCPDNFYNSFNYFILPINSFSLDFTELLSAGGFAGEDPEGAESPFIYLTNYSLISALAASSEVLAATGSGFCFSPGI